MGHFIFYSFWHDGKLGRHGKLVDSKAHKYAKYRQKRNLLNKQYTTVIIGARSVASRQGKVVDSKAHKYVDNISILHRQKRNS